MPVKGFIGFIVVARTGNVLLSTVSPTAPTEKSLGDVYTYIYPNPSPPFTVSLSTHGRSHTSTVDGGTR